MTLATASVADLVPPRERGRYQGYIQLTFLLASLVGPLLGGLFVDQLSWRWAFYVNIPLGTLALVLLTAYLPAGNRRHGARIDYAGAALLAGGIVAIMLIATWGGSQYSWGSPQIIGLIAAALCCWRRFWPESGRPPSRCCRCACSATARSPSSRQGVCRHPVAVCGDRFPARVPATRDRGERDPLRVLTLPLLAASAVSTIAAGQVMARTGRYKIFPVIGLAAMSAGLLLFATLGPSDSRLRAALFMIVFGAGFGMVTQILMVAIQNAVSPREIGTATAAANLFRALGGSIGVAVYGAVFAAGLRHWLPLDLHHRAPHGITAAGIQTTPGQIHALAPTIQHGIATAVGNSLHDVFLVAAPIALVGFLIVLALPETPLKGRQQTPPPPAAAKPDTPAPTDRIAA